MTHEGQDLRSGRATCPCEIAKCKKNLEGYSREKHPINVEGNTQKLLASIKDNRYIANKTKFRKPTNHL